MTTDIGVPQLQETINLHTKDSVITISLEQLIPCGDSNKKYEDRCGKKQLHEAVLQQCKVFHETSKRPVKQQIKANLLTKFKEPEFYFATFKEERWIHETNKNTIKQKLNDLFSRLKPKYMLEKLQLEKNAAEQKIAELEAKLKDQKKELEGQLNLQKNWFNEHLDEMIKSQTRFNVKDSEGRIGTFHGRLRSNGLPAYGTMVYSKSEAKDIYMFHGSWTPTGKFLRGQLHLRTDNSVYIGGFDDKNKKSGRGKTIWYKTGATHVGEYNNDDRHGKGIETCCKSDRSVEVYKGDFRSDLKDGQGICWYADGSTYDGQWSKELRHGVGTFVDAHGIGETSMWTQGMRQNEESWTNEEGRPTITEPGQVIDEVPLRDVDAMQNMQVNGSVAGSGAQPMSLSLPSIISGVSFQNGQSTVSMDDIFGSSIFSKSLPSMSSRVSSKNGQSSVSMHDIMLEDLFSLSHDSYTNNFQGSKLINEAEEELADEFVRAKISDRWVDYRNMNK